MFSLSSTDTSLQLSSKAVTLLPAECARHSKTSLRKVTWELIGSLDGPRLALFRAALFCLWLFLPVLMQSASAQTSETKKILVLQTFSAEYPSKWRIVGIAALFFFQTLLIAGLLFERTRRRRASRGLAESEERYRNVVESQTELICRYLPDSTLTFVNDAYCRYFSRSRRELIGSKFIDLIPLRARERSRQHIQSLIDNPRTETNEHEVIRADGSIGWQQWVDRAISRSAGEVVELQGIGRDITERKRAEQALRETEERNRAILRAIPDLMFLQTRDGVYLDYHSRDEQALLIPPEQFLGRNMSDVLPPDLAIAFAHSFERALDTGGTQVWDYELEIAGRHRWFEARVAPCNGNKVLSVVRDITERKKAEEQLSLSEERFAKAFKSNPQPMSLTTFDEGLYIDINESFLQMSGYTREEVIGRTSIELNIFESPGDRALLIEPLATKGSLRNLETRFRTKSGHFRVLLGSAELLDLGGQKCILIASSDITERKSLEEELRLSEREFATLVQNSPDIISRLDRNLRYIYISPTVERTSGIPPDCFIGKTPGEIAIPQYDWQAFEGACREAFETRKTVARDYVYGGRNYWTRVIPEFTRDGLVESVMTISEDVTQRLRQEKELLDLTLRLFTLQDDERRRIARELHDGTAQNLFAISLNLAKVSQLETGSKPEIRQLIDECQSLGDQSLQEIRTLSYLLHPPLLDQAGLVSALQWYVEGFSKRSGIYVDVTAQQIGRLPSEVETALFRIVQEGLTNVRRHSGSGTASIRLERRSNEIVLEIKDRGQGLSGQNESSLNGDPHELGVGIPGMRQRLRQLGGRLEITSNGYGTAVAAIVPLKNGASHGAYSSGR